MNSDKTIQESALDYLRRNWSVIPLRFKDKRSTLRWHEFQYRKATEDDLNNWNTRWPDGNIGIVTGLASGMIVVDIDPKHGGDDSLFALEQSNGALPKTVEAITGGGGHHLYFSHPGGVLHNRVGLATGIDIRGDGGYVVAPPSRHISGARYAWAPGHAPDQIEFASMPEWLIKLISSDDRRAGRSRDHWCKLVQTGVSEGERNRTIASLSGHLLWHGVDPDVVMEMLMCWNRVRCNPPLSDEDVVKTIESITRTHEHH